MRQKHFDLPFTFFLSCFRTNCGRTFQSHFYNFAKCQTLLPLKHLRLVSFEYKACNFHFTQYLQGKSTNFPRYRKYFVSNAIFHDHPRETIYIFLINSLDCTRCPDSSAQRVPEPDPLPGISFDTRPYPIQF